LVIGNNAWFNEDARGSAKVEVAGACRFLWYGGVIASNLSTAVATTPKGDA
jgi:hypothetical protein